MLKKHLLMNFGLMLFSLFSLLFIVYLVFVYFLVYLGLKSSHAFLFLYLAYLFISCICNFFYYCFVILFIYVLECILEENVNINEKIALHTYLFIPLLCFRMYFRDKCKYKLESCSACIFVCSALCQNKNRKISKEKGTFILDPTSL